MTLRSWQALTIALLLASASPPPRVSNALIADAHDRDGSGKTLQSRGRNRIGHATPIADVRSDAGVSGGRTRPRRSLMPFVGSFGLPIAARPTSSFTSPAPRATFRLRC